MKRLLIYFILFVCINAAVLAALILADAPKGSFLIASTVIAILFGSVSGKLIRKQNPEKFNKE